MKVIKTNNLTRIINDQNQQNKPLIAIWGFFDGWHLGHQALLNTMLVYAKEYNYQTLVISFDVKPQSILLQKQFPVLLSNQDKIHFLEDKNIDYYCQLEFNQVIATTSAQDFIKWLLLNNTQAVVVNPDIRFGAQGKGTLKTLQNSQLNVLLTEDLYDQNKQKISSSYIKKLLENKEIVYANSLLANNYTLTGTVINGIKEGRTLGFPTANLNLAENYIIPGIGVYLTRCFVANKWYRSLTVIIMRNNKLLVESYLLDFNQDIYGQTIKVQFLDYLRDNIHFSSVHKLIKQINLDVKKAIVYFNEQEII